MDMRFPESFLREGAVAANQCEGVQTSSRQWRISCRVNLSDAYKVRSNRESGFGRYDVMIEPLDKTRKAFILEFKVLDPDDDEKTLEDTLANARAQIEEKNMRQNSYLPVMHRDRSANTGLHSRGKSA